MYNSIILFSFISFLIFGAGAFVHVIHKRWMDAFGFMLISGISFVVMFVGA